MGDKSSLKRPSEKCRDEVRGMIVREVRSKRFFPFPCPTFLCPLPFISGIPADGEPFRKRVMRKYGSADGQQTIRSISINSAGLIGVNL
jgi:hypothetical protein